MAFPVCAMVPLTLAGAGVGSVAATTSSRPLSATLRPNIPQTNLRWIQPKPRRRLVHCPVWPFGGSGGSQPERQVEEEEEGGKMVQLDASSSGSLDGSSEDPFGPLAILAVGFTPQEFERLRRLLHEDMEAEMVKVVPAPPAAMAGSLGAALELEPVPAFEQAPLGTRRVCFLSGMYAAEVMETISAVREAGLPECVFAAAVPNNYDRQLAELVQEVFADHQAMNRQRQQQQQQQAGLE